MVGAGGVSVRGDGRIVSERTESYEGTTTT